MGHDYHEGGPNYNPSQLYYDGCTECKYRADDLYLAIAHVRNLREAWHRAARFEKGLLKPEEAVSNAEVPLLRMLWAIQVHLERYGLPLGAFPGDLVNVLNAHLGGAVVAGPSPLVEALSTVIEHIDNFSPTTPADTTKAITEGTE